MPGKYGSSSVSVTIEDAPGGTARDISNYLLEGVDPQIEAAFVETTTYGDAWGEHTPTGMRMVNQLTFNLIWDTSTNGPHDIFKDVDDGPQDDGREVVITAGDGKTLTGDVRVVSFQVVMSAEDIHKAVVVLQPTGAWTWA